MDLRRSATVGVRSVFDLDCSSARWKLEAVVTFVVFGAIRPPFKSCLVTIPGIATPPLPKIGCGALVSGWVNWVGSWASCCAACRFSRGPVAVPPIKAARETGCVGALAGTCTALLPMSFLSVSFWYPARSALSRERSLNDMSVLGLGLAKSNRSETRA